MEKIGYILLSIVALCWLIGVVIGLIAIFPFGIIGLLGIIGIGLLFVKVLRERLRSKQDDYYSKTVEK
jgi:hypothetical protein